MAVKVEQIAEGGGEIQHRQLNTAGSGERFKKKGK
ncbi:hypothetical protein T458_22120 [Brevibacillus panacihumi W25]|uniref:Uncharacterized protein n=1 Tax=Brevibacillus panacihumi W25 TaxID=1408254 RepID=V6M5V6_9BACL|nr:hypothetical protein T458_22120 [Brevibacillus panacihumi W25]